MFEMARQAIGAALESKNYGGQMIFARQLMPSVVWKCEAAIILSKHRSRDLRKQRQFKTFKLFKSFKTF